MAMFGQSSFRRILLTRVLLLSIPILLLGVAVTFRKARTSLLYTARINLTESAIRKAQNIQSSIRSIHSSMAIASDTDALRSGSSELSQIFLDQLSSQLPTEIQCLQLLDLRTQNLIASTCGDQPIKTGSIEAWANRSDSQGSDRFQNFTLTVDQPGKLEQVDEQSQLDLVLSTPVYDQAGRLRYSLSAEFIVKQMESAEPWSLLGYTAVVDQDGKFIAHPYADSLGRSIQDERDIIRFKDVLDNSLRGTSDVRHINFTGDGTEWLVGFSPISIPISATENQTWTVMAVTPLESALKGLDSITQILVILTTGLLAAHLLAMLYIARDLSRPIEKLSKYARRIHKRNPLERAPKNFSIRELNHLAEALDNMVSRLEERARELESAWQEAETANQLKSEFLANTSHELRTPLNAIIGCIRLVRDGCCDTPEEEFEFLEQADKAAVHLLKIINDLLDIRRIEEEGLPLCMEAIDLCQVLQDVIEIQTIQIQQKGLSLTVPDLSTPILVQVDPARLKQVLLNVVYNATKFTDKGGITITTRIESAADTYDHHSDGNLYSDMDDFSPPSSWVVIAVRDTGIGIDPDQQHKLFRPFVMVDGSTTRKFEGTGLGLAISRSLIEMMGGSITLHSDGLDQGTTVEITLPIATHAQKSFQDPVEDGKAIADATNSAAEHSAIGS
jgi:signal transduction histidine kinase